MSCGAAVGYDSDQLLRMVRAGEVVASVIACEAPAMQPSLDGVADTMSAARDGEAGMLGFACRLVGLSPVYGRVCLKLFDLHVALCHAGRGGVPGLLGDGWTRWGVEMLAGVRDMYGRLTPLFDDVRLPPSYRALDCDRGAARTIGGAA